MFADRNKRSSSGFRALLGRFLHGLLPHRLLQRVGATWSYLMGGPWVGSSFLPYGWLLHRSVRSVDLPEVLEALGLRSNSWEELGECLDDLGPWKELLTPEVGVDLDLLKSSEAASSAMEDPAYDKLTAWQKAMVHSKMQALWEPGFTSWNDVVEPNGEDKACHRAAAASHTTADPVLRKGRDSCKVAHEEIGHQLQASSLDIRSYILNDVETGGELSRVEWKADENIDAIGDNPSQSKIEIQHIRNKRLQFLQQSKTGESLTSDVQQEDSKGGQRQTIVPEFTDFKQVSSCKQNNQNSDLPLSQCLGSQSEISDQCELLSDINMTQGDALESPNLNAKCCSLDQLPLVYQEVDKSGNLGHICPSPDKDQGYHSLEYWQCSLPQDLTVANIELCELDRESVPFALPTACPSFGKDNYQNSEDMNSDLPDKIPFSSVTFCTNKHIGYILGTVVSDDDDADGTSSSSCDECEEDDDGFDSEGSMSTTDHEISAPENLLWNSFCSADPYDLQNFTASLQTGVPAIENVLPLETQDQHQSDEESWCDSNAESDTDSESDCAADEEKNIKLWNAFLKSDDPYNPLYFKAPVQTSDKKRQSSEIASTNSDTVCRHLPDHKVTCQAYDLQQAPCKETCNIEDIANLGPKKVTFHENVTIHYVCIEERKGHWEEVARDRCRFQRRIQETEFVIGHCLAPDHRQRAWETMQGQWGS